MKSRRRFAPEGFTLLETKTALHLSGAPRAYARGTPPRASSGETLRFAEEGKKITLQYRRQEQLPGTGFLTGFTLIEMLLVIALIAMLGGFSIVAGVDFYRGYAFRAEVDILVAALQKARSQAMSNRNQTGHGLHVTADGYTLFEGQSFNPEAPTNLFIPAQPGISRAGPADIMFTPLSAVASPSTTMTLSDGSARTRTVNVNTEGRINW